MKNSLKHWIVKLMALAPGKKGLDVIDESSDESFPASDPPAWAGMEHKAPVAKAHPGHHDAVTILKEEHRAIMKMIYIMHDQTELLEKNKAINIDTLQDVAEFLRHFVEDTHYCKEEDYFFPALKNSGAPLQECPLSLFKEDHELSLSLLDTLEGLLPAYQKNPELMREKLIDTLTDLKDIYTRHTLKEENYIFPLAEKYLSQGTMKSLLSEFAKLDRQL